MDNWSNIGQRRGSPWQQASERGSDYRLTGPAQNFTTMPVSPGNQMFTPQPVGPATPYEPHGRGGPNTTGQLPGTYSPPDPPMTTMPVPPPTGGAQPPMTTMPTPTSPGGAVSNWDKYAGYGNKLDTGIWDQANEWSYEDVGRMLGSARNEAELYAMYSALANDPNRGSGNRANALARQWIEENKMGGGSMGKFINYWEGDSGFRKPVTFDMRTGQFIYEQTNRDWDKVSMANMHDKEQGWTGSPASYLKADGKYNSGDMFGQTRYTRGLDNWQNIVNRTGAVGGPAGPSYAGQYGNTMNNRTVQQRRDAITNAYGSGVWGPSGQPAASPYQAAGNPYKPGGLAKVMQGG